MSWFTLKNLSIAGIIALALGAGAGIAGYTGGCDSPFSAPSEDVATDTDVVEEQAEPASPPTSAEPNPSKSTTATTASSMDGLPCDGDLFKQAGRTTEMVVGVDAIKQIETNRTTLFLRAKEGRLECRKNGAHLDGKPVTAAQIRGAKNFTAALGTDRPDVEIELDGGRKVIAGNVLVSQLRWDRSFSPK